MLRINIIAYRVQDKQTVPVNSCSMLQICFGKFETFLATANLNNDPVLFTFLAFYLEPF